MKKLFTLLCIALAAFTFKAGAQATTCNAEFSWNFINGNTVKFVPVVNDSPLVSHQWNFADGSPISNVVSPTHSYLANGTYAVVHTVIRHNTTGGAICTNSVTRTIVIQQAPPACNLVVDFSWNATTANPLMIEFHNLSTPLSPTDSTTWTFGDGGTSYNVNPVHTYTSAGTYTVCLVVKKNNGPTAPPCIKYICKTIVVQAPCNLVVDFNWTVTQNNPLRLEFHNLSTPLAATDSIKWTFGDGSTSNDVNPVHTYANAGTYTVCLTVKKNNNVPGTTPCVRTTCKTIVVQSACNLVVDFNWTVTQSNPLRLEFHNLSTPLSPADSTIWTFGDGTTSYDVNPVHTYANAGTYQVCLIVKKANTSGGTPCVRYSCKTIVVQAPCNLVVDFNWTVTQNNPLRLEFHNLSTPLAVTDSTIWSFGDGSISYDVNPVHTYAHGGTYTVCLTVKKNNNAPGTTPCVRTTCKTIVVQEPCNLVVDFNWTVTQNNPLRLEFHNLSTPLAPADSTIWTFGDGTTSYDVNPVHTYTAAGTYQVCLIVKKASTTGGTPCIRYSCKTIVVQAPPCNLVVDFNWTVTQTNPLRLEFHNLSTPLASTDSTIWSFGDGTGSFDVNPVHTYAHGGTYTVCLIVKKYPSATSAPCVRYICKTIVVQEPCNLVANFTWQVDGANAQKIWFTNTSTPMNNIDSVRWTFGDGTSATVMNPDHTYAQPGTYNVCLRIEKINSAGTTPCVREICKTIVVQANCNFTVNYIWHVDSLNNKKVIFTNTSNIPASTTGVLWTFGDGTSANTWNAVHEYAQPGRYYVCLRIERGPNCVRYKCDSITIAVPPPPCQAQSNFTFIRSSTNSQTITFTPDYQSNTAQYTWTFGDGTGSNAMIATHHYAQAGTYTACLTVVRSVNCASTTCKTVVVTTQVNCDSAHVTYTYQRDPNVPNKVYFYASSNFPILDQTWTITKLPATASNPPVILHQNNPSYVFPDTGYYRVCLRVTTLGGCVKEYCNNIHIEQLAGGNACSLQSYPNPATTQINTNVVLTAPEMINAYMYNSMNVLVREKHQQGTTGNNVVSFTIGDLPVGVYTIKFIYGNHICYTQFYKSN